MRQHHTSGVLAYTDTSRAEMLKGLGEAMAELRHQAREQLARGRLIAALRLHALHGDVTNTLVDIVRHPADPGTDSLRIQLVAQQSGRVPKAGYASDLLAATANQTARNDH